MDGVGCGWGGGQELEEGRERKPWGVRTKTFLKSSFQWLWEGRGHILKYELCEQNGGVRDTEEKVHGEKWWCRTRMVCV